MEVTMWVAYAYVAVIVSCTNPGTPAVACHGEAVEGFVSKESCEAGIGKLAALVKSAKRDDMPVRIDAECVARVPPREA
jgi:hypothetical protein